MLRLRHSLPFRKWLTDDSSIAKSSDQRTRLKVVPKSQMRVALNSLTEKRMTRLSFCLLDENVTTELLVAASSSSSPHKPAKQRPSLQQSSNADANDDDDDD
jgi:hypothetical protein